MATRKKKRIGNQIPTQSVVLPFRKSRYKEAVELYKKTGRKIMKWQQTLLRQIMATRSGLWTHTKFGYSLPRRNGKNEIAAIREMWGLMQGERILHTAHRTTTSHTAWERLMGLLDAAGIEYDSLRAIGRERVEIKETGGRVEFRTRSSKGGLGEGFDLLVIDEAQEYTTDQESALKYVVTDSKNPQTIFCGTPPTPLSSGTVFTDLRKSALEGSAENVGWAEWSVEEVSDPYDRELWYLTNPSLGIILTERAVQDEIGQDEIDFNIQRLLWLAYNQKSAISETEWMALLTNGMPELTGKLHVGIKYGNNGENVALSVAVKTKDERIFVEAIDCQSIRNGNAWILNFLDKASVQSIVIDGASGQSILAADLKEAGIKPTPILPTVREVITANSAFRQAVYQGNSVTMGNCRWFKLCIKPEKRPIGSRRRIRYKSQFEDYDIAPSDNILTGVGIARCRNNSKTKVRY